MDAGYFKVSFLQFSSTIRIYICYSTIPCFDLFVIKFTHDCFRLVCELTFYFTLLSPAQNFMNTVVYVKGTNADQDARFADKKKKLMKSMKFAEQLEKKVLPHGLLFENNVLTKDIGMIW